MKRILKIQKQIKLRKKHYKKHMKVSEEKKVMEEIGKKVNCVMKEVTKI